MCACICFLACGGDFLLSSGQKLNYLHIFKVIICDLCNPLLWFETDEEADSMLAVTAGNTGCLQSNLKVQFTPKSKRRLQISPLTCRAIKQPRLFWCELTSFGDIGCRDVCRLSNLIKVDGTTSRSRNDGEHFLLHGDTE